MVNSVVIQPAGYTGVQPKSGCTELQKYNKGGTLMHQTQFGVMTAHNVPEHLSISEQSATGGSSQRELRSTNRLTT